MSQPATIEGPGRPIQLIAKELAASSGYLLARLGLAFKEQALAGAEASGFELYDYSVLAILGEGARETQATIADALDVDPSRLVALLDSLEARDLVVRQRDPSDRRRHVVSITTAGREALAQMRAIVNKVEDDFFAPLDRKDRETLHQMLVALAVKNDPRCCPLEASLLTPGAGSTPSELENATSVQGSAPSAT
jgi:DNA-binding MarR family transcriptional regulator